eukprot:COSAG06_NODE_12009_length_1436_cov_0.643231_1_plen_260_part_10
MATDAALADFELRQRIYTGKWRRPTQHELNHASEQIVGQRVYVCGWGEGVVRQFVKSRGWGVHSSHLIELDAHHRPAALTKGVDGWLKVKLRRKQNAETEWLKQVQASEPPGAAAAVAAAAAAAPRELPAAVPQQRSAAVNRQLQAQPAVLAATPGMAAPPPPAYNPRYHAPRGHTVIAAACDSRDPRLRRRSACAMNDRSELQAEPRAHTSAMKARHNPASQPVAAQPGDGYPGYRHREGARDAAAVSGDTISQADQRV